MKLCYTAIFGNYDTLKEPKVITPGWEYVCFTDQLINSKAWNIVYISPSCNSARYARSAKINSPFNFQIRQPIDESLWFDASIQIMGNLDELVKPAADFDGMVLKHPHRISMFQESMAVTRRRKDSHSVVQKQMQKYKDEGFIQRTPLVATGILYRKNNERTRAFSDLWWKEVSEHSHRDQLSFNYAQQKSGVRFLVSHMNIYDRANPYFLLHKHL